jgi:hypothetical protein
MLVGSTRNQVDELQGVIGPVGSGAASQRLYPKASCEVEHTFFPFDDFLRLVIDPASSTSFASTSVNLP